MTEKIEMWNELGPQIILGDPIDPDEFVELLVDVTGRSEGMIVGILTDIDKVLVRALRSGRRVKLPNGLRFRPVGKSDGSVVVKIYYGNRMTTRVNHESRVKWKNKKNIGKSEAEMIVIWNEKYPDRPIKE